MTEQEAHEAIIQHWKAQWEALRPMVPWTQLNELGASTGEWIRVALVPAVRVQAAFGKTKRWRQRGTIGVQIFTPTAAGTARASELADDVRTVLEGQLLEGDDLVTYAGSSGSPLSDGVWFMLTVTVPYSFDELRAR